VPALRRQPRPHRRVVLGDLAQVDLVDLLRRLDQLGDDLALGVGEERVVVVDDRARQLRDALRRVGRDGELVDLLRHADGRARQRHRGRRRSRAAVGNERTKSEREQITSHRARDCIIVAEP
jgi:hypothetical protein